MNGRIEDISVRNITWYFQYHNYMNEEIDFSCHFSHMLRGILYKVYSGQRLVSVNSFFNCVLEKQSRSRSCIIVHSETSFERKTVTNRDAQISIRTITPKSTGIQRWQFVQFVESKTFTN